jgi:hypothetical protein
MHLVQTKEALLSQSLHSRGVIVARLDPAGKIYLLE